MHRLILYLFSTSKRPLLLGLMPCCLLVQQVAVGSFRILRGLLIIQEPEGGVEAPFQFLFDLTLGYLPVFLVDPLCFPSVSLDQLLGGSKPVIANPF